MRSSEHEGDDVVGLVHRSMLREMKNYYVAKSREPRCVCRDDARDGDARRMRAEAKKDTERRARVTASVFISPTIRGFSIYSMTQGIMGGV